MAESFNWSKFGTDLVYKYVDARLNKYQRPPTDPVPRGGYVYAQSQARPATLPPPSPVMPPGWGVTAAPAPAPAPVSVVSPVVEARRIKAPLWKNPVVIAGGVLALVLVLVVVKSR